MNHRPGATRSAGSQTVLPRSGLRPPQLSYLPPPLTELGEAKMQLFGRIEVFYVRRRPLRCVFATVIRTPHSVHPRKFCWFSGERGTGISGASNSPGPGTNLESWGATDTVAGSGWRGNSQSQWRSKGFSRGSAPEQSSRARARAIHVDPVTLRTDSCGSAHAARFPQLRRIRPNCFDSQRFQASRMGHNFGHCGCPAARPWERVNGGLDVWPV